MDGRMNERKDSGGRGAMGEFKRMNGICVRPIERTDEVDHLFLSQDRPLLQALDLANHAVGG